MNIPLPARLGFQDSTVVEYRDGSPAHVFLAPDEQWRIRKKLVNIDPAYIKALLRLEDKRFHSHWGVDPVAVLRSAVLNIRRGRVVSGASTLTMQLVRLLEPRPRTFRSKIVEAFRAIQLEIRMTKSQILEQYLRFLPFGKNVEGVETAALTYFGHQASALTPAEITTLLAVPQAPRSRYPRPKHRGRLTRARNDIANRLLRANALPRKAGQVMVSNQVLMNQIKTSPVPVKFISLPRNAPHLATWLKNRYPTRIKFRTTLDRGLQTYAEALMLRAGVTNRPKGIQNGVAVLVDHEVGEVRAAVGSFDFKDAEGGQIVGFEVPRSPGSALKPFIYALAIDGGHALPSYLVRDIPVHYGTYAPTNYDGQFRGLVRLDASLSLSLNIPFVDLLSKVGVPHFMNHLRLMGARHLKDEPGYYGLSAAVGGLEITPLEMAGLYATLAQNGRATKLQMLSTPSEKKSIQIMSPGAAWLTRKALSFRDRPDFPGRRALAAKTRSIHWKTGTSYGHKDAWAAGSGPTYTGVIWLGNFSGAPSAALVGAKAAGPILFDLLESVARKEHIPSIDPKPPEVTSISVCAYSGYPMSRACPRATTDYALVSNVPTAADPFHIALEVDRSSGLVVNASCRQGLDTENRHFVTWPIGVSKYLNARFKGLPRVPAYANGCTPMAPLAPPRILSPPPNQRVMLIEGMATQRQAIPLIAEFHSQVHDLRWFVNGKHVGQDQANRQVWWVPKRGRHELVVMDTLGRSTRQTLTVQ